MDMRGKLGLFTAVTSLVLGANLSQAADNGLDLVLPASRGHGSHVLLAENTVTAEQPIAAANTASTEEKEDGAFTTSNAHQYMGLATIALAAATAMTAPEECESSACANIPRETDGTHAKLAWATVGMATATVVTGVIAHWDDFAFEDGLTDPDNLHVILGTVGAALMGYAAWKSAQVKTGQVSHAGTAIAGAVGMGLAIALTW